jgi:AraC family transcriptional regulator
MQPHKLKRVVAFIEDHLAERLVAADLAATIHMSRFHFSRTFKAATGLAPYAFVTMRRMELSKALLEGTELPLRMVAVRVGYRTQAHFTGMFRKRVGTTPSAFRRVARGDADASAVLPLSNDALDLRDGARLAGLVDRVNQVPLE